MQSADIGTLISLCDIEFEIPNLSVKVCLTILNEVSLVPGRWVQKCLLTVLIYHCFPLPSGTVPPLSTYLSVEKTPSPTKDDAALMVGILFA